MNSCHIHDLGAISNKKIENRILKHVCTVYVKNKYSGGSLRAGRQANWPAVNKT